MIIDKNGQEVHEGDTVDFYGVLYSVVIKNEQLGCYENGEFIPLSEVLRVFKVVS